MPVKIKQPFRFFGKLNFDQIRKLDAEGGSPAAVSVYDVPLGKKMPDVVPCFIEVQLSDSVKTIMVTTMILVVASQ